MLHTHLRPIVAALAAALALNGCTTASFPREFKATAPAQPFQQVPATAVSTGAEPSEPGIVDLSSEAGVNDNTFLVRSTRVNGGNVPRGNYRTLSVTESGLYDVLQMLLAGTNISLHVEGGPRSLEKSGPVTVVGLAGDLPTVLNRLSTRMGFFWSYQDGVLTIEPTRQFVVDLPAAMAEDSLAGITNTIQSLGGHDTYLDRVSRTLSFRANAKGFDSINRYMSELRATGSMIVYRLQIFEVDLSDKSSDGIAWNRMASSSFSRYKDFNASTAVPGAGAGGGANAGTPATPQGTFLDTVANPTGSMGAMFVGRHFSLDLLLDFLKTQGTVRALSQPRLTIMNRGKGAMRVGETRTIISKVGSNLSNGISQLTTETTALRTGLDLGLSGEESSGTIITRARVELNNVVAIDESNNGSSKLQLPRTADNEFQTTVRMPAGYTAILGGITKERVSTDRAVGVTQNTKVSNVTRSELVIVMTPSLVRFTPSKPTEAASNGPTQGVPASTSAAPSLMPQAVLARTPAAGAPQAHAAQ